MHINSYPNRECRKWLKKSELYIQQRCCVRVQDCGYLSERDDHWQRFLARMRTCPRIVIIINSNSKKLRQLNLFYIVYHWILVVFLSCMPLSITKRLRRGWVPTYMKYVPVIWQMLVSLLEYIFLKSISWPSLWSMAFRNCIAFLAKEDHHTLR